MNIKSFVGTIGGVVGLMVFALLTMTTAFDRGNHDRRLTESEFMTSRLKLGGTSFYYPGQNNTANYYKVILVNANVFTPTSDIGSFFRDPVGRLRQQGIAVPTRSERHWQALTAALRRLSNPRSPASSTAAGPKDNPNLKNEIVRLQIPGGWISVAGDLDGGGKSFLADSVGYLRTQGVNVPSADEPAWRQLAAALKALRLEYANATVKDSKPQGNPGKLNFEHPFDRQVDPPAKKEVKASSDSNQGGNASSQVQQTFATDTIKMTYGAQEKTVNIEISISASDRQKFLKDPVNTLRSRGIGVPQPAEVHWREFTSAVQSLASPANPTARKKPGRTTFANIVLERGVMPGVTVTIVGDWNAVRTNTSAADPQSSITNGSFITKPVVTLRAQGMNVPASDERAWEELAAALKALQRAYANPKTAGSPESSAQSESTVAAPQKAAARSSVVNGYSIEFYAGKRLESGTIVGTCNTTRGCVALKDACRTLQNHSFTAIEGGGICLDQANTTATGTWFLRNSNPTPAAGEGGNNQVESNQQPAAGKRHGVITFKKEWDVTQPSLGCEGGIVCSRVKNICATLGGSYTQINNLEGLCRH